MNDEHPFFAARSFLLENRHRYAAAYEAFRWPVLEHFNWALDYFDVMARGNTGRALWIIDDRLHDERLSFEELRASSNQTANLFRRLGIRRGDRMLVMLPNVSELWEITLAAMKLGVVISPASTLLTAEDLGDRVRRAGIRHVVTTQDCTKLFDQPLDLQTQIIVDEEQPRWISYYARIEEAEEFEPEGPTRASDPFLLYFTSGTTARPKIVVHSHQSYPVGHLSTMYWIGLRQDDLHWNISSPGWAKHAWSSFFAPWNAGAAVFVYNQRRFDAKRCLGTLVDYGITSLCAPPTVWRSFVLEDLSEYRSQLRSAVGAGEPLNPEVIAQVKKAWGISIRDGYGQTETTCQIGNPPAEPITSGSMGKPMPGYHIELLDGDNKPSDIGEIAIRLDPPPAALMQGYLDDAEQSAEALGGKWYRTSDVARRDEDGYYWYIGRTDDVFKSSDYRISPFELESILIEHAFVAEAAVVPSPHAVRLAVPKAFIVLSPGTVPSPAVALELFQFLREKTAPYKRVRRLEFAELPKTISGKIRRVELRAQEHGRTECDGRRVHEYWEEDFTELS